MPPTSPNPNPNPGSPGGGINEGSRHTNTPGTPGQQRNHITDVEEVSYQTENFGISQLFLLKI